MTESHRQTDNPSREVELPLPNYDQLPLGALTHRVRTLNVDGVETLLAHERKHANRVSVISMLENRLGQLRDGAAPSDGSPTGEQPEQLSRPAGTQSASPSTQGPPVNPPSQGDPTNPAQPRSTT